MKRKYIPDLRKQMAQCEANYMRLMKLMPDLDRVDERCYRVTWPDHQASLCLEVEERFTYTTTLKVTPQHDHDSPWLGSTQLVVRLYHDANTAEVVCTRRKQLSGVYSYPNKRMRQPDEKNQINEYLGEWLTHCLSHGHMMEPVFIG